MRRFAVLAVALGLVGCNLDSFRRTPVGQTGIAKELNVDTTAMTVTPSGLKYQDLKVGDGSVARRGTTVTAGYTGWLMDGKRFDGGQYEFRLGDHGVIEGWDEGLIGMRVGGKRKLVIPPSLGYGPDGSPPAIPPNATLIFDIELLSAR